MLVNRLAQKLGVALPLSEVFRWSYSGDDRSVNAEFRRESEESFAFEVSEYVSGEGSATVCEGKCRVVGDDVLFDSPEAIGMFDFFCEAISGMTREPT